MSWLSQFDPSSSDAGPSSGPAQPPLPPIQPRPPASSGFVFPPSSSVGSPAQAPHRGGAPFFGRGRGRGGRGRGREGARWGSARPPSVAPATAPPTIAPAPRPEDYMPHEAAPALPPSFFAKANVAEAPPPVFAVRKPPEPSRSKYKAAAVSNRPDSGKKAEQFKNALQRAPAPMEETMVEVEQQARALQTPNKTKKALRAMIADMLAVEAQSNHERFCSIVTEQALGNAHFKNHTARQRLLGSIAMEHLYVVKEALQHHLRSLGASGQNHKVSAAELPRVHKLAAEVLARMKKNTVSRRNERQVADRGTFGSAAKKEERRRVAREQERSERAAQMERESTPVHKRPWIAAAQPAVSVQADCVRPNLTEAIFMDEEDELDELEDYNVPPTNDGRASSALLPLPSSTSSLHTPPRSDEIPRNGSPPVPPVLDTQGVPGQETVESEGSSVLRTAFVVKAEPVEAFQSSGLADDARTGSSSEKQSTLSAPVEQRSIASTSTRIAPIAQRCETSNDVPLSHAESSAAEAHRRGHPFFADSTSLHSKDACAAGDVRVKREAQSPSPEVSASYPASPRSGPGSPEPASSPAMERKLVAEVVHESTSAQNANLAGDGLNLEAESDSDSDEPLYLRMRKGKKSSGGNRGESAGAGSDVKPEPVDRPKSPKPVIAAQLKDRTLHSYAGKTTAKSGSYVMKAHFMAPLDSRSAVLSSAQRDSSDFNAVAVVSRGCYTTMAHIGPELDWCQQENLAAEGSHNQVTDVKRLAQGVVGIAITSNQVIGSPSQVTLAFARESSNATRVKPRFEFLYGSPHRSGATSLSLFPKTSGSDALLSFATGGDDGVVQHWQWRNDGKTDIDRLHSAHTKPVASLELLNRHSLLVSVGTDRLLGYNYASASIAFTWTPTDTVTHITRTPHADLFMASVLRSDWEQLKLYDVRSDIISKPVLQAGWLALRRPTSLGRAAFHPLRRSLLAQGCPDGTVRLFDLRKAATVAEVRLGESPIQDVVWQPSEKGASIDTLYAVESGSGGVHRVRFALS